MQDLIFQIQNKYRNSLVVVEENLGLVERIALWQASNFHLNTSLRDGLSILPLEFIAVKHAQK